MIIFFLGYTNMWYYFASDAFLRIFCHKEGTYLHAVYI